LRTYKIALYPGDGIGVDVSKEAVKALRAVEKRAEFSVEITEFDWGHRYWKRTRRTVPEDFLDVLKGYDAVFLGAVGDPANLPDHVTLAPLIQMRQQFDQYACVRPARLLPGVTSPIAGAAPGDIDMVVVRENSEGEYVDAGGGLKSASCDEIAVQTAVHSRKGVERILRYGFDLARRRGKKLTMATKSNAMKHSMVMWDRILDELVPEYPDVSANKFHIDALTMHFVRCPERFDVVVASNLFGDILSDLGGAITGSLGLAPSANINPERTTPSLFEPVHGSAPDIAGKGIANPIAAIRSAAMMLDFLGEKDAAEMIERAVYSCLQDGKVRTPDLGGKSTTVEVGDDIAHRIAAEFISILEDGSTCQKR
jgi:tartrate dehydrogenase/decarboxylase / D-malate dehydrogenase